MGKYVAYLIAIFIIIYGIRFALVKSDNVYSEFQAVSSTVSSSVGNANNDKSTSTIESSSATSTEPTKPKPKINTRPPVKVSSGPIVGACPIYPSSNAINTDISKYPVHPKSSTYIESINDNPVRKTLQPGFGLPINIVGKNQKKVSIVDFTYRRESDIGPYPIPMDVKIQNSADRHVTILDKDNCVLYELFDARLLSDGWHAGSGAIFNLKSNKLRPDYWTSADAAGLPLFPLIIRYDEVKAGEIKHAVRVTVPKTHKGFIHPATHASGINDSNLPPMGLRLRLKASFDISSYPKEAQVVLIAMKKYGLIVADHGSAWTFGGEENPNWNLKEINTLKNVPGSAFEAVYTGEIIEYPK